jgi:hypothetical protein
VWIASNGTISNSLNARVAKVWVENTLTSTGNARVARLWFEKHSGIHGNDVEAKTWVHYTMDGWTDFSIVRRNEPERLSSLPLQELHSSLAAPHRSRFASVPERAVLHNVGSRPCW